MVVCANELAAADAEVFPDAIAVEEAVVERADAGVGLVDQVAVDPEEGHGLGDWEWEIGDWKMPTTVVSLPIYNPQSPIPKSHGG